MNQVVNSDERLIAEISEDNDDNIENIGDYSKHDVTIINDR
jgi:hypothetical protein